MRTDGPIYADVAANLNYSEDYTKCIESTVEKLLTLRTSNDRPGMLLGKIQSGKTRTFLGIIALAMDNGFDNCIILTKGTNPLARQTYARVKGVFKDAIDNDDARVWDVMSLPENITAYEQGLKLILVCKKEDDNLRRLERAICDTFPILAKRRTLIIDDEADLASLGFRSLNGGVALAVIPHQIERLRTSLVSAAYLQVTATPYSLYLQPTSEQAVAQGVYHPMRPSFTELVPIHSDYIGGEHYFERSHDENDPSFYFRRSVTQRELDALHKQDGRTLKVEDVLVSTRIPQIRHAVCTFIVGGSVRRMQAKRDRVRPNPKFSFIFHLDRSRDAHRWQETVVRAIVADLQREAVASTTLFRELVQDAYDDLSQSVDLTGRWMPSLEEVIAEVQILISACMVTKVNSDNDIKAMLNEEGELELRNPLNIFIGGQILDRGLTVSGVVGFYYGRNPNRFQQDAVLQHCRMYGARPFADLGVTRFYTSDRIFQVLERIHQFDDALRAAFEAGDHGNGVVFVTQHGSDIVACSPNKLSLSSIEAIRPGGRALPLGFDIVAGKAAVKTASEIEKMLRQLGDDGQNNVFEIDISDYRLLMGHAGSVMEFSPDSSWDVKMAAAQMQYVTRENGGKLLCSVRRGREIVRLRKNGRPANAPDTSQREGDVARATGRGHPVLFMIEQNGGEARGWKNGPFWWPVVYWPQRMTTVVFSDELDSVAPNLVD